MRGFILTLMTVVLAAPVFASAALAAGVYPQP